MMFLSKKEIDRNIKWLLKHGSPSVKYLTHKHLLEVNPLSQKMRELWKEVEDYSEVRNLFSKQQSNGSWGSGAYKIKSVKEGYTPLTPKYVTTVWILPILGDLGYDIKDPRIKKACEYVMTYQCPDSMFYRWKIKRSKPDKQGYKEPTFPCDQAIYLTALGSVGMSQDKRLENSYNQLLWLQREDGGWVSEIHRQRDNWTRSCPWSSYFGASALYYSQNPAYRKKLLKALNFLVWHLSKKKKDEIKRFFYHGHNMVKELLMFSENEIDMSQKPIQILLDWLLTMYHREEGFFEYRGKSLSKFNRREDGATPRVIKYRLYHLIETDWLTYYMTRIVKNL